MVFSLFEYLDQVNCNHRYIVCSTLADFSQKTAIIFDLTKIEIKKIIFNRHEILLRIQ